MDGGATIRTGAVLALVLVLAAGHAAPLAAQLPRACAGETTAEVRMCLRARLAAAADTMERYLAAARRVAVPRERFDSVQTAWVTYREIACRDAALQYEGGSLAPVVALQCQLELTRERTRTIWRSYLREEDALPEPRPDAAGR